MAAGVPQSSVLGPLLYISFTADIPAFADDTALIVSDPDYSLAVSGLQAALGQFHYWTNKWRSILLNSDKSVNFTFTLKLHSYYPIKLG